MIIIAQQVSAEPQIVNPLPGATTLRQVLQSTPSPVEQVFIEYRLNPSHNIWFDEGGANPTKSITFSETVDVGGTPLAHNVMLVATHGGPSIPAVQIEEIITDAAGGKQSRVVLVGL